MTCSELKVYSNFHGVLNEYAVYCDFVWMFMLKKEIKVLTR